MNFACARCARGARKEDESMMMALEIGPENYAKNATSRDPEKSRKMIKKWSQNGSRRLRFGSRMALGTLRKPRRASEVVRKRLRRHPGPEKN